MAATRASRSIAFCEVQLTRREIERRREERRPASGNVRLYLDGPPASEIPGTLLDRSLSGFRVRHCCPNLSAGDELGFRHVWGKGRARVVWTRILASGVESGFLIVSPEK